MGEPDGMSITPRSRRESAIGDNNEQFRLLVQGVIDYAIFMLDPAGYVTTWNFGAERIKGYAADEIIGHHFFTFYTDEDKALDLPAGCWLRRPQKAGPKAEGWRVRKDGTRFWANVVIDAIRKPNAEIIGFAKVTRDLTERRAAQEALEKAQAASIVRRATARRLTRWSAGDHRMLSARSTISQLPPMADRACMAISCRSRGSRCASRHTPQIHRALKEVGADEAGGLKAVTKKKPRR